MRCAYSARRHPCQRGKGLRCSRFAPLQRWRALIDAQTTMSTLEVRCLDAFPSWLRTFADDARVLATVLESEGDGILQRRCAGALNYLFKSLDLIPDGLEDLGFMDDAFVLRAAAHSLKQEAEEALASDSSGTL